MSVNIYVCIYIYIYIFIYAYIYIYVYIYICVCVCVCIFYSDCCLSFMICVLYTRPVSSEGGLRIGGGRGGGGSHVKTRKYAIYTQFLVTAYMLVCVL